MDSVDWSSLPLTVMHTGQAPDHSPFTVADPEQANSTHSADQARPIVYLAAQPATMLEEQWEVLFSSIESGGTAIIGALKPEDNKAIQALMRRGIDVRLHFGIGSWMGCYHWASGSAVFAGLPANGLALTPYAEVLPKYILSELGGEVLAGSLRNTQSRLEAPAMLWFSDIERIRYGKGTLFFCQYRAFEAIDRDPVAARLAYNLLQYAARLAQHEGDHSLSCSM